MEHISIKGLTKSYGKGTKTLEVLKGIDLEIEKGETVAILGASGAGKSTFLNIMGALDHPTSGEVFYNSASIFTMGEKKLASFRNSTVGFVFQFHHLLAEFTALENVMLPALIGGKSYMEAKETGEALLRDVGLKDRLDHKPGELSGGEQQRAAMVRALVQTPEVLLADEPTGNLDTKTGEEVFELLLKLNREKNITLAVVTHNERLAQKMNRRLTMVDGRLFG
ncbi:MAG: ABC transporter ATP-binding protein [Deltaproteobacteria bacterium]|nr:ABC transporter ATP-binding protein [Deltaproteobacteria bacterium]